MQIYSLPDLTGGSATVPIGAAGLEARVLILTSLVGTSRFGDSSASATRGVALPPNVPVIFRASDADKFDFIQLSNASAYIPSGSTLTIAYGI